MRTRLNRVEQVERNRGLVLDAARRVFLDRGYAAASLEAIAEEAGFSKGVIYSQFDSKADLFLALLDSRIAERGAENEAMVANLAGRAGVLALVKAGRADSEREAGWGALLLEFRAHAARDREIGARYAAAHERTVQGLAALLERLAGQAEPRPTLSPRDMAQLVLAFASGLTLERAVDPEALGDPALADSIVRALGF